MTTTPAPVRTVLVVGASRGLGLELARTYLDQGRLVFATVRSGGRTALHDLADTTDGRLVVVRADITEPDDLAALRAEMTDRLGGSPLDLLFVNAGVTDDDLPVEEVATEEFVRVMVTNALGPLRAVEALGPLVCEHGTIAVMSSRQGSVSLNTRGGHEVYRASKSALNQLMRSYAARQGGPDGGRTLLLVHPGWVQTGLGGDAAPLTVEESVAGVVRTVEAQAGTPGLEFRDHQGAVVPW